MSAITYTKLALKTAPRVDELNATTHQLQLLLGALGASDEAGEIAGMVKKHVFHEHPLDWDKLHKEIGDVLWYLNYLTSLDGKALDYDMALNINKLVKRYPEGFSIERSLHREVDNV